ncbi:MAG TPA: hypothetical protein VF891_04870 [Gaiellaceae bacterium]
MPSLLALLAFAATGFGGGGPQATASCAEAIYTTPANAPPRSVQAVRIGSAVFNSLAHLTTVRDVGRPSRSRPFYTVKSPLTILARGDRGVILTLVGGKDAVLVYNRRWLRRPAAWRHSFARMPRSIRLPLCRDRQGAALNTQYAGGFLLRKLGCVTIQVRAVGETRTHQATVPLGVRHC